MPSRRHAFTLVELLVVVGVVSLLVAMLMPAFAAARRQARAVHCAANLRSIGQALTMYVQAYRYYPGSASAQPRGAIISPAAAVWTVRLRVFLGGSRNVFLCPEQDERCEWGPAGPQPVSAADPWFTQFGYEPGEPLVHEAARFSYGYNRRGAAESVGSILDGTHRGLGAAATVNRAGNRAFGELPAGRVKVPAEMIAVTDATADGVLDYEVGPTRFDGPSLWPGAVHRGGANVLFCDGHVTWNRREDLVVTSPTWSELPKYRLWNNDHRP